MKAADTTPAISVFYSYAHEDKDLRDELDKHLGSLRRLEWIQSWYDGEILPGMPWREEIGVHLSTAGIILLLVSPDFMASDYCYSIEMNQAIERHQIGKARVIPILLRPVDLEGTPISELQMLPPGGKPVTSWSNRDEALVQVARGIRRVVTTLRQPIFVASSPLDQPFVTHLLHDLSEHGLNLWSPQEEQGPDAADQQHDDTYAALHETIRGASAVVLIVSPNARHSRAVKEYLGLAATYQRAVIFVWAGGDSWETSVPEGWQTKKYIDARSEERYKMAVQEIVMALSRSIVPTEVNVRGPEMVAPSVEPPRNPYKGLRAFRSEDTRDFFGRDQLIQEMVEDVQGLLTAEQSGKSCARLLAIIGPSGSGKSSAVMAGLLPQLQRGALPGSPKWVYLEPIVPGQRPIQTLTNALSSHFPPGNLEAIRKDLEDDSAYGLHSLATSVTHQSAVKMVLLIDQFEELFTQTIAEDERRRFIDLLLTAVTEPRGPVFVLLTLRADFYDRPLHYPALGRLIEDQQLTVLPMGPHDLRDVIEKPAALPDVQLVFEENLVGDLLFETQGQAGALPLLEFTLDQLFERRADHQLTLKAYDELGGLKGALAEHAESTYASLPSDEHRRLARDLFLRLINPGVSEQDTTRRRVDERELSLSDPQQTTIMREVADVFVAARLLTKNQDIGNTTEEVGNSTIEVSHEALIREWTRLGEWLRENRKDIVLQQAISEDAAEWVRRGKPISSWLYRGTQLIEAQEWAERNMHSTDEEAFIQTGAAERQRQELKELDQKQRELDQKQRELALQRRVVSRQRLLIAALSVFSVVVIALASLAGYGFLQAQMQAQIARSDALATNATLSLAQNKLDLALLLSVKATQVVNTLETRKSLLSALEANPHIVTMLRHESAIKVNTLAFGPDDHTLVSSDDDRVYIWDTKRRAGNALPLDLNAMEVGGVAVSPDGRFLVTANSDGVWLWDIQTGARLDQLNGKIEVPANILPRTSLAFSSDGTRVASARCRNYSLNTNPPACAETDIAVWNRLTKQQIGHPCIVLTDVNSIALSPDGTTLASGSDTSVQLCKVATGQLLPDSPLFGNTGANSVAFSPNGNLLAAGSNDKTIHLWNVASGKPFNSPLVGHTDAVTSVAFSRDNQTLASGSLDQTVRIWDVTTGKPIGPPLIHHTDAITSVAFSQISQTLAAGSRNGSIFLWNLDSESPISQREGETGGLRSAVFSGTTLFTGSGDGKIFLFDMKTRKALQLFDTIALYHPRKPNPGELEDLSAIQSLVLSRDGQTLASGRRDGTIFVWKTGKLFARFHQTNLLRRIALSSDGQTLASVDDGDTIMLWNVAKKTLFRFFPPHSQYQLSNPSIALNPDGTWLAAGSCWKVNSNQSCEQGQLLLWDVGTGKLISQPLLHSFEISDVAFSPDGQTLASSGQDGILLCDVPTSTVCSPILFLPGDVSSYDHILFSPHGKLLASYSSSGPPFSFILWDLTRQEPLADAIPEASSQGSIAFSLNEQQLVSVVAGLSNKDIVTLWNITIESWQEDACAIANRNLNPGEWHQFLGDERYRQVCPDLPLPNA